LGGDFSFETRRSFNFQYFSDSNAAWFLLNQPHGYDANHFRYHGISDRTPAGQLPQNCPATKSTARTGGRHHDDQFT
jgi:hypothetical protein